MGEGKTTHKITSGNSLSEVLSMFVLKEKHMRIFLIKFIKG